MKRCPNCGRDFQPRKSDHIYCTTACRYAFGKRLTVVGFEQQDPEAVERLFDPSRDPNERVRPDDWFCAPAEDGWKELYAHETVEMRRRWFRNLFPWWQVS
jgi:hypothetical protein